MTDERFDEEPDFDDPAHAGIRDLLASAKEDSPIPADVAARLDATLAELVGPPTAVEVEVEQIATVVPLARRLAPRLLVAAAVVVVAGAGAVGINQVVHHHGGANDSVAATAADSAGSKSVAPALPEATRTNVYNYFSGKNLSLAAGEVPVLTTADFADQVAALDLKGVRLLSGSLDSRANNQYSAPRRSPADGDAVSPQAAVPPATPSDEKSALLTKSARGAASKALRCSGPKLAGTASYPILIDEEPAVLVVHQAEGGKKLVQAWTCDGSEVLAYTFVTA